MQVLCPYSWHVPGQAWRLRTYECFLLYLQPEVDDTDAAQLAGSQGQRRSDSEGPQP